MIWKNTKPRAVILFSFFFFLSYLVLFSILYMTFPTVRENFLLPVLNAEVAFLDPSSDLRSFKSEHKSLQGKIHFTIALRRHPGGNPDAAPGQLILQANFTLRDNILQLCLMLALALSCPGLSLMDRLQALATVLLSWLCLFTLLYPFAILDDGVPPIGVRLTLIHWWNVFLNHKGNALLTLLFLIGNMYKMYLLGHKNKLQGKKRNEISTS